MRFPNKVTPYKHSVIARFPDILLCLEQREMSPKELFDYTTAGKKDMGDFLSALDCLFALGKIGLNEERGVLYCVGRDQV